MVRFRRNHCNLEAHARLLAAQLPLATRLLQIATGCGEDLFLPA